MNDRRRYLETMLFGTPDRVPFTPGGGRKSTREKWHEQGLPAEIDGGAIYEYAYRQVGGTLPWPSGGETIAVDERMIPRFEEKVIERRGDTQIVQDWKGNICEIGSQFTTEYLRNAIDFVTRRWVKCPVESRDDWPDMKRRYDADDVGRYPDNLAALGAAETEERTGLHMQHFSGPFWQLREWLGFEGLCTMFYDDPSFVEEMIEFWEQHVIGLMKNTFRYVVPDELHLSEDMAYKSFSMISPQMVRKYLLPTWKRWGDMARSAGVQVYGMDSDGFVGELIPIWIEAGINACDPIEVAAGNDIVTFRKEFGHDIAFRGGVDKRAMAKGGSTIIEEIDRNTPVIKDGGFIPSCDHGIPSDISWPHFLEYVALLAKVTGWL